MGWSGLNRTEFDGGLNPREDADHVSTEEVYEGVAGACDAADARQQPLPGNSLSTKAGGGSSSWSRSSTGSAGRCPV
jgi:hypothetical protein